MSSIERIHAREILDSRGWPTVSCQVFTRSGAEGVAAVPSGASTGSREAVELRDGDPHRYLGKGVLRACAAIEGEIQRKLRGQEVTAREALDQALIALDGTANKARLGANSILAVSLACARAAAAEAGMPFYAYLGALAGTPASAMTLPVAMYQELAAKYPLALLEDGWAEDNWEGWRAATVALGSRLALVGDDINDARAPARLCRAPRLGATPAWGPLRPKPALRLAGAAPLPLPGAGRPAEFHGLLAPALPAGQTARPPRFVTNPQILQKGIEQHVANAILIKLNQIGTVSETLACMRLAKSNGYGLMVSHRSGETLGTSIADLAVGAAAGKIKSGSVCHGERVAKYNRLLEIERELGGAARFAGRWSQATC